MSRGMNLDELRRGIESECREENIELRKEIERLESQITHMIERHQEEVKILEKDKKEIGAKCRTFSNGLMCRYCDADCPYIEE